jgi:hypothetical protein
MIDEPGDELAEQRLLASARAEFSPDAHAATRVLTATEVALAAAPIVPPLPDGSATHVLWHAPGLATRLWSAVAVATSAGVIGYGLGATAHEPVAKPTPAVHAQAPVNQPEVNAAPAPIAPPVVHEVAAPAEPSLDVARAPREPSMEAPSRPRQARVAVREDSRDALQREIDGVKEMEASLRAGNPSRALSLLAALDEAVPRGQLQEERRAGYAIAQCTLGLGDGGALIARFTREFPGSAYEARVRARCAEQGQ